MQRRNLLKLGAALQNFLQLWPAGNENHFGAAVIEYVDHAVG